MSTLSFTLRQLIDLYMAVVELVYHEEALKVRNFCFYFVLRVLHHGFWLEM